MRRRAPLILLLLLLLLCLPPGAALAGAAADGTGGEAAEIGVTAESGLGTGDPGAAAEEGDLSIEDGVNAWLGELDLAAWQAFLASLPQDVRALWADADLETLVGEWASGGMDGAPDALLLRQLGGLLLGQARASAGLLLTLLGLAFLTALVQALTAGREAGVQDAAGFVCRCFSLSAVLAASLSPVTLVLSCMDTLAAFMELALPALTLLLTAVGGVASAGVFQPAMTALCGTVTGAMRGAVVPLAVAGGVMGLVGALSARVRMGETAGLLKRLAKWLIGAVSALYLGATAVRGMAAAAYDGVANPHGQVRRVEPGADGRRHGVRHDGHHARLRAAGQERGRACGHFADAVGRAAAAHAPCGADAAVARGGGAGRAALRRAAAGDVLRGGGYALVPLCRHARRGADVSCNRRPDDGA